MPKRGKDTLGEYEQLKKELLFDQVREILNEDSNNWREKLEIIGFEWHDEENQDLLEEIQAVAENINQQRLVAYFEGHIELDNSLLTTWINERNSKHPNYPLFRRYFRRGNERLKGLLLSALTANPTDRELLLDLAFFHDHKDILNELQAVYTNSCVQIENLEEFEQLAKDFFYNTITDEYNALSELKEILGNDNEKRRVIDRLIKEQEKDNLSEDIEF